MSATRGLAIPIISVSLLLLTASAQAQVSSNLEADSLRPSRVDMMIVASPHIDSASSFESPSTHGDAVKVRSRPGKAFWLGWGVAEAFSVVSVETTVHCEHVPGCSEGNPVFGKEASRLELYAPRAAVIAAGMLFCRHWKRRNPNDDTPTLTVLAVDAIWGADAGWDVRQLVAARQSEPRALSAGKR